MSELDGWTSCPRCKGALRADEPSKRECQSCGLRIYASSKPTACALVVGDDGRILLARRAASPYEGAWDLPGGFLSEGEHPLDTIRRELKEETALEVEPRDFLGVWTDTYSEDGKGAATLNLYWTATVTAGEPEAADDVQEVRWFDPDDLPSDDEFAFHITDVISRWKQTSRGRD